MSLALTQLAGFGVGVRKPSIVTYLGGAASGTNASSYTTTFDGISLGAEDPERVIIAIAHAQVAAGTIGISSVTLNGSSMSPIIVNTGGESIGIYALALPTGSTTDVTLSLNSSHGRAGMEFYRAIMEHANIGVLATNDSFSESGGNTMSLNIPAGPGILIAGAYDQTNAAMTFTWSGVTEQSDRALEGGNRRLTSGCIDLTGSEGARIVSATRTGSFSAVRRLIAASFY